MVEDLDGDDAHDACFNVDAYPNTILDKHEAEIEVLMLMYATTPKQTFTGKRFVDCALGTTNIVKSTHDTVIEIKIPTTVAAALNDKHFSYKWRMAIQSELQQKIENGYKFEAVITSLDSRKVMKGVWIFDTEANLDTTAIDFKAPWVNDDSTKITTVTYTSNIAGVNE